MTVYIGVPTINLKKYLVGTVESIEMNHPWKLLVIDNGSGDETKEWIEKSGYDYIFNQENLGVAKSWNQIIYWGLSHDDCEAIFILNNDLVMHEEAFDRMLETLFVEGKDAVSGTNVGNNPSTLMYCTKPIPRYSRAMNFSCFGLTVPTITRVGLFDEGFKIAYFEDNDYHHRMRGEGIDASCDLWAWFAHYGSRTVKEAGIPPLHNQFNANRKYFYEKWGFYPGSDEEREKAKSYNEK